MSDMSPDARNLLEAGRSEKPGPDERKRMKAAVFAAIAAAPLSPPPSPQPSPPTAPPAAASGGAVQAAAGGGSAAATTGALGFGGKIGLAVFASTLIAGALYVRSSGDPSGVASRPEPPAVTVPAKPDKTNTAATPEPRPVETQVAGAAPEPEVEAPAAKKPSKTAEKLSRPSGSIKAIRSRPSVAEPPAEPAPAASSDPLLAELQLLRRAKVELNAGRPTKALAILGEHRRNHEQSALAGERDAMAITALCGAGRNDDAIKLAEELVRRSPRSVALAEVRRSCAASVLDTTESGSDK